MILFRPVGLAELELIAASGWKVFPPRLEIQPIFYPVLNFEYAAQIARDWNTRDPVSGFAGWVTRFEVEDEYAQKFEPQTVGAAMPRELWVPSEEMAEFNAHMLAKSRLTRCLRASSSRAKLTWAQSCHAASCSASGRHDAASPKRALHRAER